MKQMHVHKLQPHSSRRVLGAIELWTMMEMGVYCDLNSKGGFMSKSKHVTVDIRGEVYQRITRSVAAFNGDLRVLESAIGALVIGQSFGWKALYFVHSHRTLKKYAEVLGFKSLEDLRDSMPFEGPHTDRLRVLQAIKSVKEFWAVVTGEKALPEGEGSNKSDVVT
jgi:hypothetical protein